MGQRLSKYVDNELAPEERRNVEEHLKSCSGCRELLSIFLRNESMLSKSLATEQYGEAMIDRVLDRIEEAPEAEPAEETRWERTTGWLRERPWIQLAAAAVFVIALVAVIMTSHSAKDRDLQERIDSLTKSMEDQRGAYDRIRQDHQQQSDSMLARFDEVNDQLRRERLKTMQDYRGDTISGAVMSYALVVRARFTSPEQYLSFSVWRADEVNNAQPGTWRELKNGLTDSVWEDATVEPGKVYWYRFSGRKKNLDVVESVPVRLEAPLSNGLNPQTCLTIRCVEVSEANDLATFAVSRYVSGQKVTYYFTVLRGQALGRVENGVDFKSGFELDSMEDGDETMKVTFAWPKFDDEGRPIMDTAGQQAFDLKDQILAIRPNKRAVLRPVGAASGQKTTKIWRDAEILIPLSK